VPELVVGVYTGTEQGAQVQSGVMVTYTVEGLQDGPASVTVTVVV